MRLYKAQVCPISDESKVAKFLLSGSSPPIYEWSLLLLMELLFVLLLFTAVAFAFTFGRSGCGVNCIGEYCESIP